MTIRKSHRFITLTDGFSDAADSDYGGKSAIWMISIAAASGADPDDIRLTCVS
jgi:hypothetical protein